MNLSDFRFADGGHAIYYQLEKSALPLSRALASQTAGVTDNLMFVISGSDCISMGAFLPQYFTGLEGESGSINIFILHKRYIPPGGNGVSCGEAFVRNDYPSRWQADQLEFISAQLAALAQRGQHPKRLIIFGISEGAELAPILAQHVHATHLVLVSHAGLNALDAYRTLAQQHASMQVGWQQLQAALGEVPADKDTMRIHGRSWRYWSEIATIPQQHNLLQAGIPILLGVGEADPVIPPFALDHLQAAFQAANRQIRILRFPNAGHNLAGDGENYLPDFMHQLDNWLLETPAR
ncbi:alpha/beta hydrolase family protein [Undibacterium sp. TJN19]|uniref:alpha/beta hydrolase family protein n=1 Tax=Undibacterium sp. TJN19 TaxID=3413055 RepID=UPI003BF271CC